MENEQKIAKQFADTIEIYRYCLGFSTIYVYEDHIAFVLSKSTRKEYQIPVLFQFDVKLFLKYLGEECIWAKEIQLHIGEIALKQFKLGTHIFFDDYIYKFRGLSITTLHKTDYSYLIKGDSLSRDIFMGDPAKDFYQVSLKIGETVCQCGIILSSIVSSYLSPSISVVNNTLFNTLVEF